MVKEKEEYLESVKKYAFEQELKKQEIVNSFLKNLALSDKDKLIRIWDEIRDTDKLKLSLFNDDTTDALQNLSRGFPFPVYDDHYEVIGKDIIYDYLIIYFNKLDK